MNLSELLESALEKELREREGAAWRAENESAIRMYNDHVREHGVFSQEWRRF